MAANRGSGNQQAGQYQPGIIDYVVAAAVLGIGFAFGIEYLAGADWPWLKTAVAGAMAGAGCYLAWQFS